MAGRDQFMHVDPLEMRPCRTTGRRFNLKNPGGIPVLVAVRVAPLGRRNGPRREDGQVGEVPAAATQGNEVWAEGAAGLSGRIAQSLFCFGASAIEIHVAADLRSTRRR